MITDVEWFRRRLPDDDFQELAYLANQLDRTRPRNLVRAGYYDLHNSWKDLGVAIPSRFRDVEVASGWGAKSVDHLARRVRMEAFTSVEDSVLEDSGLEQVWDDNNMELDLPQAITSSLIHSPGFLWTSLGDTTIGEPEVVISAFDALHATGRWNWSRRGLDSALLVVDTDEHTASPTRLVFIHKQRLWNMTRRRVHDLAGMQWTTQWDWDPQSYSLPRVPVEPLLYHPRLGRAFGGSRINRAVMYLIDVALRTLIRTELGAEFFTAPNRYGLNIAEEDVYKNGRTAWDAIIGKMLLIGASENPEDPDPVLGQFPQVSMQPHADMFRMLAAAFSGETGVPVTSLGVIQDNPSSAEAIYAGKEDLVLEAEECNRFFTPAVRRTGWNAIQMRDNLTELPPEYKKLGVRWTDPSTPSRNQAADFVLKQVTGGIVPADSSVALEMLGHSPATIARVEADRRRSNARETIRSALAVNVEPPKIQSVGEFQEPGIFGDDNN